MTATTVKADDDDLAALDALESEAKEFNKVSKPEVSYGFTNRLS